MFFKVKPLTEAELEAVTIVFHQYETGLREGTIYTRVSNSIDTGLKEKGMRKHGPIIVIKGKYMRKKV